MSSTKEESVYITSLEKQIEAENMRAEFNHVFEILERRVKALVELPIEAMAKDEIQKKLNNTGERQ